jgi:hypothetical protein
MKFHRQPAATRFPASRRSSRRALAVAMLCAVGSQIMAAGPEIHLPGGVSAHLHRELVLIPQPDDAAQPGRVKALVRDINTGAGIASDILTPFGRLAASEPYVRAVWSPDGSYVAFNIQWTRHTRQTLVYHLAQSRLTLIRFPEYWLEARRALGRRADFVGGTATPVRWIDRHTLAVRSVGTLRDETPFDLVVTATVTKSTAAIRSVATR